MGMMIAEPIQTLEYLKNCGVFPFSTVDGVLFTEASIDVAIDTMRKYQKIEQIYKDWFSDAGHTSAEAYGRIGEVLKDATN